MVDRAYVGAGGALVGSSWASAGLPGAGLPPASLRDNRCVTAPAPPGRIDPKDGAAEAHRPAGHPPEPAAAPRQARPLLPQIRRRPPRAAGPPERPRYELTAVDGRAESSKPARSALFP